MNATENTRSSLLGRLGQASNVEAWNEFVEIYAPLIYRFARTRGLQDADARDLAQEVMMNLTTAISDFEYDRGRGSFRNWLFKVSHNAIRRMKRGQSKMAEGTGDSRIYSLLTEEPDEKLDSQDWERQHQRQLFLFAAKLVQQECQEATWSAFWQVAMVDRAPGDVASDLGMSIGAVYMAKCRVLARIKKRIAQIEVDLISLPETTVFKNDLKGQPDDC